MVKKFAIAVCLLLATTHSLSAQDQRATTVLGVRLGLFTNSTDELAHPTDLLRVSDTKTNFYAEAFLNYYFTPWLAGVLNLGSYSKGDITFQVYVNDVYDGQFVGQASIYPMQLGLKLSPFAQQLPGRIRPYLEGGGALIIGRETATLGPYDSYFAQYTDGTISTESDFNWWAGGGAEIPLSEALSFDLMGKYLSTKFSGDIAGISDYSGWQVSVGISYRLLPH